MPPLSFRKLLAEVRELAPGLLGTADPTTDVDPAIESVAHDHRAVTPGSLFVARRGERFDAHDVIDTALAGGAVAVVGERPAGELAADISSALGAVPYLMVPNARLALPYLAASAYDHPSGKLTVIGVTGTDGKTTTSYLLHWLLTGNFVTGLISTAGVRLGGRELALLGHFTTPEATDVQRLLAEFVDGGASHAVLESSSHGFSLNRLDAVDYAAGVVTNLSPEHLDHHKTLAAYLDAKATLVRRSRRALLNRDDPHHEAFRRAAEDAGAEVVSYGRHPEADVRLGTVQAVPGGLVFDLHHERESLTVRLPMIGDYNAWNAAAAVAAALAEGVTPAQAVARLASFGGVPGRMQVLQAVPFTVVVDFAHTPPALAKALSAIRPPDGRVLVVIGAAGDRDPGKRAPLGREATLGADFAIFTEEDSRSEPFSAIADELRSGALQAGGTPDHDFTVIEDRHEAIAEALRRARPGDVVLLAGKGHERTLERSHETLPWDEAAIAARLLAG